MLNSPLTPGHATPLEAPLVSCVMPLRLRMPTLERSIAAFLAQDYPNRELVIVEDRSSPTQPISMPRVRHLRVNASSTAGLLIEGVRGAAGPFVAVWDHESWYPSWRLRYQVGALLQTGFEVSASKEVLVFEPGGVKCWSERTPSAARVATSSLVTSRERGLSLFTISNPEPAFFPDFGLVGSGLHEAERCCVLLAHGLRQFPRRNRGGAESRPLSAVTGLMGSEADAFQALGLPPSTYWSSMRPTPRVSCIMPTFDRAAFVSRAVRYFERQDYPNRELIVVDDGPTPIQDLLPADPRVRYLRLPGRATIGVKRNVACEIASGELMINWDDDDWYGPARIRLQVADLLSGRANMTAIIVSYILDLRTTRFWSPAFPMLSAIRLESDASVAAGTMAFTREIWRRCGGFPDQSVGEDSELLARTVRLGLAMGVVNHGIWAYVRHGANSWRFDFSGARGPEGWVNVPPPTFMPVEDLAFYRTLAS